MGESQRCGPRFGVGGREKLANFDVGPAVLMKPAQQKTTNFVV